LSISVEEFEVLYRENYKIVRAVALKYGLRDGRVDDAIQESFVTAYEKIDTLKDPKAFRGWVTTIARNYCLGIHRKSKPEVTVTGTDQVDEEGEATIVLESQDMFGNLDYEHCITLLQGLIEDHKGEPRASIARCFYLEHCSIKEICTKLALKQNTVLSHLRRFRLMVTEAMLDVVESQGLTPY
jgi:RNA polymerase sigma-70 factor (ECF subfamily)